MTIIEKLVQTPDRKADEWLLPKYLKFIYLSNLVVGFISGILLCFGIAWGMACSVWTSQLFQVLACIFLGSILFMIFYLLWIILCRLLYEVGILLFCIFQAQRDTVNELEMIHLSIRRLAQAQLTSNQYHCDRLAEICDAVVERDN